MSIDAGLRKIFRDSIPEADWQSIETGGIGKGVPDSNACFRGQEVWIEHKRVRGWTYKMRPGQVAWIERRTRAGGRVFIACRKVQRGSSTLWILYPQAARFSAIHALLPEAIGGSWTGRGPASWDWVAIKGLLFGPK